MTSVSTVQATAWVYSKVVSAGARGTHTLKITNTGGNGWVLAIEGSIGTTGIRVTKVGRGGARAGDMVGDPVFEFGSLKTAWNPVYAPDLSVIFFGFNDYYTG